MYICICCFHLIYKTTSCRFDYIENHSSVTSFRRARLRLICFFWWSGGRCLASRVNCSTVTIWSVFLIHRRRPQLLCCEYDIGNRAVSPTLLLMWGQALSFPCLGSWFSFSLANCNFDVKLGWFLAICRTEKADSFSPCYNLSKTTWILSLILIFSFYGPAASYHLLYWHWQMYTYSSWPYPTPSKLCSYQPSASSFAQTFSCSNCSYSSYSFLFGSCGWNSSWYSTMNWGSTKPVWSC